MGNQNPKPVPGVIQGPSPGQLVQTLRQQIAAIEGARRQSHNISVPSGCGALDRLLPGRGFRQGTLVEWLAPEGAGGAGTLAVYAARQACREGGALVVLDRAREFYPPAAARMGIQLEKMIVVQTPTEADNTWALDQALRCSAVAAVLAWPEKLDTRTFRRLQLAAEQGRGLGLLVRPKTARYEPSWADVRLLIEPLPAATSHAGRRLRIQVLRSRGTISGGSVELEINDETHTVHLAGQLADPTAAGRAAGA